jgi:hypothetical protein
MNQPDLTFRYANLDDLDFIKRFLWMCWHGVESQTLFR